MSDVPSIDQISNQVYLDFAAENRKVVEQNPICQKCNKNPSVQINRWGQILACCQACLNEELEDFNRYCEQIKAEAETDDTY